jgi:hypothetical protein
MERFDLETDGNNLAVVNGDLVIAESSQTHIQELVGSHFGDFRFYPGVGVNATDFAKAPVNKMRELTMRISRVLRSDGFTVQKVSIEVDGSISVSAK